MGQTRHFSLGMAIDLGEANPDFKPVEARLKIDPVSYSACAEVLVSVYIYIYTCVCVCVCVCVC